MIQTLTYGLEVCFFPLFIMQKKSKNKLRYLKYTLDSLMLYIDRCLISVRLMIKALH